MCFDAEQVKWSSLMTITWNILHNVMMKWYYITPGVNGQQRMHTSPWHLILPLFFFRSMFALLLFSNFPLDFWIWTLFVIITCHRTRCDVSCRIVMHSVFILNKKVTSCLIHLFSATDIATLTNDFTFGLGTSMDKVISPFTRQDPK